LKGISLFSGCGGLDLGFMRAGHQIVWANDSDPDCVRTYRHNIGSHIVEGDIRRVSTQDIPDAEIVIGGFPCQGFSCANMLRSPDDERNELYLQFLRIVKEKRPLYFLAENVRGLLSLAGGEVMRMILEDFRRAGYSVKYQLFDAADFGVPQRRRRVVIVGTRTDLGVDAEPDFPVPTHAQESTLVLEKWVTITEALHGIPEPDEATYISNHVCSRYKVTNRNFTGHRRTDPEKPSPTILARGNGEGGVCALQHPRNHRRLSVRESAIIQTFPSDFLFFGSLSSMYRQVGNAVPVLLARSLGAEFINVESRILVCQ
jgi:DNA (cytosine-5)-methyltransferase 1